MKYKVSFYIDSFAETLKPEETGVMIYSSFMQSQKTSPSDSCINTP